MNDLMKNYGTFVNGVTSEDSSNTDAFLKRVAELQASGLNFAKMDTACSGIAGEGGEIVDLWKKIKFHGKPWDEKNKEAMFSECGDMMWYLLHLMECLDTTLEEVLEYNVKKLESRYPGGKFSITASEHRNSELDPNYEGKNT